MNKFLLSAFMLGIASTSAFAAKVDSQFAADYGRNYLDAVAGKGHSVKNIESVTDAYIMVNYYPQGWAIVSADDHAKPIVGYSDKGSLQWHYMPEDLKFMLGEFSKVIRHRATQSGFADSDWAVNPGEVRSRADDGVVIEPLIKVEWNQSGYFNKYCPGSGSNKALVGCVAVSMSQAMSVQRFPARPVGQVSYAAAGYGQLSIDFDFEAAYDWDAILSGANNYDEAARLLYHAGMSVLMNYGTEGSGIPSNQIFRISDALVNNFGYPANQVKYYYQSTTKNWEEIIQNELMAGRAVIYNAIDPNVGGHSFNVDGYDINNNYHVNWGWGGQSNGYFALGALRDPYMNFTEGHRIVVGIGASNRYLRTLNLSDTRFETGLDAGSVLGVVTVNGADPEPGMKLSISGRVFDGGEFPFVLDGNVIKSNRVLSDQPEKIELLITVKHDGETMTQGFRIAVEKPKSIEESTSITYNRALGQFTVNTKHNVRYVLTGSNGAELASGKIEPLPELKFDRSTLTEGTNKLTLISGDETKVINIVNSK